MPARGYQLVQMPGYSWCAFLFKRFQPFFGIAIIPFLIFSGLNQAFSQETFTGSVNKVKAFAKAPEKCDTAYINALNRVSVDFVELYPDSVLVLINEVAGLLQGCNYDLGEVEMLRLKGDAYNNKRQYDSAIYFMTESKNLAKKTGDKRAQWTVLNNFGMVYVNRGNYLLANEQFYEALKIAEANGDGDKIGSLLNNIAIIYFFQKKYNEAEAYYTRALELARKRNDSASMAIACNNLGEVYVIRREYKKALDFLKSSIGYGIGLNNIELKLASKVTMAQAFAEMDSISQAELIFDEVIAESGRYGDKLYAANGYLGKARMILRLKKPGEALLLAQKGISLAEEIGQRSVMRDGHELLADIYRTLGKGMLAYENYKLFKQFSDSLNNVEIARAEAMEEASYSYYKKELQFQQKSLQQRWIIISAFGGLLGLGILLFINTRNRNSLNLANRTLQDRNKEIEQQRAALEDTLVKLQSTQAQLIHAEKMASLGELTAGIAHEIQNPLNFVNNFSEVSAELLTEMIAEADKGNLADMEELGADIRQNLEKILFHGKRADAIVKSMLYHSRTSAGKKEPTGINALCEEYLKLSYHGMRAKDKAFNARFATHFDPGVGKAFVIPQDIGRVMLNLYNNAFFAVAHHSKPGEQAYEPMVKVETQRNGNSIRIIVEDNGHGIPQNIQDKIFQPFFTTKPTGAGTGLGLSLSYDIVTKVHEGKLTVESEEGKFTRFTIELPVGQA